MSLDNIDLADDQAFTEAVAAILRKKPQLRASLAAAGPELYQRAFTVSGVTNARVLNDVWQSLAKSIEQGSGFEAWRQEVGPALEEQWGGKKPGRLETIWRTNAQAAFSAGRWAQITDPDVIDLRPYVQFDATLDARTTSICKECNGHVVKIDSDWARSHNPPLHFNCRSAWITLDEEEAAAIGVSEKPPALDIPPGFGAVPERVDAPDALQPSLDNFPPELAQSFEQAIAANTPEPVAMDDLLDAALEPPPPTREEDKAAKALAAKVKKIATADERQAVEIFTGSGYSRMRALDKGEDPGVSPALAAKYQARLEQMRALMARAPAYEGVVFRGLHSLSPEEAAAIATGDAVANDAISSASRDYQVALGFARTDVENLDHAIVLILRQRSGIPIESISSSTYEKEVILDKGKRYRVIRRYTLRGIMHVEAEEI